VGTMPHRAGEDDETAALSRPGDGGARQFPGGPPDPPDAPPEPPSGGNVVSLVGPVVGPDYEAFFLDEHPKLVALVLALSGDAAHAEDVAQEALLRAYRRWSTIARYQRPGAWTRRVALNLATSARRRRLSERRAVERLAARPAPPAAGPEVGSAAEFWAMVRTLPRRQATVVALYYLEDASVADIAAVVGCAEGTAKAHLHQARAALAARFGEPDPEEIS